MYKVTIFTNETIENTRLVEIFGNPVRWEIKDGIEGRSGINWFIWETIIDREWATVGEFDNEDDAVLFKLSWP